jgi:hypothetical protein
VRFLIPEARVPFIRAAPLSTCLRREFELQKEELMGLTLLGALRTFSRSLAKILPSKRYLFFFFTRMRKLRISINFVESPAVHWLCFHVEDWIWILFEARAVRFDRSREVGRAKPLISVYAKWKIFVYMRVESSPRGESPSDDISNDFFACWRIGK